METKPPRAMIVGFVCNEFGGTPFGLRFGRRGRGLSRAAAAWIALTRFSHTTSAIVAELGYAGRSGVNKAVHRLEGKRTASSGRELNRRLLRIERKLRSMSTVAEATNDNAGAICNQ